MDPRRTLNLFNYLDFIKDITPQKAGEFNKEYYSCNDCGDVFEVLKPKFNKCKYCGSEDLKQIDFDSYISFLIDKGYTESEINDIVKNKRN
jgi:hypothetical protein